MRVIVWWKRLLYLTIYWYRMAVLCRIYTWYRYAANGPVPCDQRSQQYTINSYKQKPMCKTEMWLLWLVTAWLLWLVNHMVPGPAMYNGGHSGSQITALCSPYGTQKVIVWRPPRIVVLPLGHVIISWTWGRARGGNQVLVRDFEGDELNF